MTLHLKGRYKMPLYLPDKEEMTKEAFYSFCVANSHLRIERDELNQILIKPPVTGETGNQHVSISFEIELWNRNARAGKTFDSSTGFELPDGSMRSPDAAWLSNEKWNSLTGEERKRFLPLAPDFVVEIISPSDRLSLAQNKMNKCIQNGSKLGWLIDSANQFTFIYRADTTVDKIIGFDKKLSGENVLPGFEFDLSVLISQDLI